MQKRGGKFCKIKNKKIKTKKAQLAFEYLLVLSFFLILTIPIFYLAYSQITFRENWYKLNKALNDLGNKIDFLCNLGEGSKESLIIDFPRDTRFIAFNDTYLIITTTKFGNASYKAKCKVFGNKTYLRNINKIVLTRTTEGVQVSLNVTQITPIPDRPQIVFVSPTPANNSVTNTNWVFINTTITDKDGISIALLEWNEVNETMDGAGENWYKNKTNLSNGLYIYKVYANDTLGYLGFSEERWVWVNRTYIVCREFNATQASGTAINPTNALISDNTYAILTTNGKYVKVSDFDLSNAGNKGNITSVEIAMEYHREGFYWNDRIELAYYLNGIYQNSRAYEDASSDTKVYFNVTSDRAWNWQDIKGLDVRATFRKVGREDFIDWYVDALWVKICYLTW